MKKFHLLIIPVLVLSIASIFSCNSKPDFSGYVTQVDSAHKAVENAELEYLAINFAATSALIKKVSDDIEFIERHFEGEMERSVAKTISDYLSAKKMVKKFGSRIKQINLELKRTKKQLTMLKTALESNATHDFDGNEFTDEYVEKIVQQELKVSNQLVEQMNLLVEQDKKSHQRFEEYRDRIDLILSSITIKEE